MRRPSATRAESGWPGAGPGARLPGGAFDRAVLTLVRRVPRGRVVTYGQLAALVGAPRAARAVGQAMRRAPPGVPWHRVINGRGEISRRSGLDGMLSQRLLLEREGVRFVRNRVDLGRYGWGRATARFRVDLLPEGR